MTDPAIEQYWQSFLSTLPADSHYRTKEYLATGWGDNPGLADELGALIVQGSKTAACSSLWEWQAEGLPLPGEGMITIVLSGAGVPLCIVETTETIELKYNEVGEEIARAEGEGDLSLEYWRAAHKRFFSRTLPKLGREFSEDIPLVCERFKVIYK